MKRKLLSSEIFKRAVSLAIVLVMVLGMVPASVFAAEGTTVYLVPNSNWMIDNARFAVYYWDDSGNAWVSMTAAEDGLYEATIPAGYSNIIFCRMNPGTTANNWNNKWNQTANLTVPTDGTNCYTVAEDTWDSGGGTWSVYPPEEEIPTETAPDGTYYVAGVAALCGSEWSVDDIANQMTWNGVTGCFEKVYTSVAVGTYQFKVTAGDWDHAWGDGGNNYTFEVSSVCDVTIAFDPDTKEITVTGSGVGAVTAIDISSITAVGSGSGSWLNGQNWNVSASSNHMSASGSVYTITYENVAAGTYEVKFAANDSWNDNWGSNGTTYTGGTAEAVYNGQNIKFTVSAASDVTLKLDLSRFDYSTKNGATFSITMVEREGGETDPSEPEIPDGDTTVTLHFMKPEGWGSTINAYLWTTDGAVTGYEAYNSWPGKAVSDADGDGWYDLKVVTDAAFNFIFNDGGNQTADLYTGEVTGSMELWVVGNDVYTEQPGFTVTIHFQKPASWGSAINAYAWDAGGELLGTWPGAAADLNANNAGWYDVTLERDSSDSVNFIFNDGSNQTADLATGTLSIKTEIWVTNTNDVSRDVPTGWSDPNRKFHVPGTFPGPSWDASSNEMTYDEELGLYTYTFENVPAANYEFKIAVNGSWDENYGAGGERDGANIAVTVPETMDVTVYYNDNTHYAVTNVTYKFVEASVSGSGIETTALTDEGLTGIYSGTVYMAAGTYTDVVITCDGVKYAFAELVVEKGKDVTFYIDPITGIYYCNASDIPVNSSAIYFNSQDETYKAPFGAVEQNTDVAFSIATGEDVSSAVLVIKGVASFPMEKNEKTGLWECTASIANIGEYDYYFVMSNGSAVAVYGDDDGYYGEGKVCELTDVMPYDLVVYEEGYETPDWMKNAVIYQIFPDRFFDGDESNNLAQTWARGEVNYEYIYDWYTLPENPEQEAMLDKDTYASTGAWVGDGEWSNEIYGGDLQGIIERIDYLKALGVNVIYLNPVFWSISNHRYDAVDYTEIDPILGTLGDFEELVAVAEANDMHIILDGVFNHVSDDSVYFDRYYKYLTAEDFDGKIGAYPYWAYVYDYMSENSADQSTAEAAAKTYFAETYGVTDYSYTEWFAVSSITMTGAVDNIGLRAGKEVYSYEGWWGYDSMPVIYSTNGSEYQTGNWAQEIIEGENSVSAYWISKGMDGWRLDVANEVSDETWQHFRDSVKALDSDAVIIGEIWDDATKYLMGDMYDSVMNYVFRNVVTSFVMDNISAEQAAKELEKVRERYPEEAFYAMMNLVGSHDTSRILSYLDGIGDDRADKSLDAAFPTYEKTSLAAKEMQYRVALIQFTYPGAPTIYYGDEIGMVGSDDPDDRRAMEWGKGNEELVTWYAKLAAIREAYPALRTGSIEMVDSGDADILAYWRCDEETEILVLANRNVEGEGDSVVFTMPEDKTGVWVNVLGNMEFDLSEDHDITLGASTSMILVPKDQVVEVTVDTEGLAPAYDESYVVAERDPNGHSHSYTGEVTTEPTCTEPGVMTYTCSCGDSYTEEIPASDHSYEAVVTAPTCTEQGYTTYTCHCGDSYVDDYVDANGHNVVLVESKDATCESNGYEYYACESCGGAEYQIILEATGHHYEDGVCTNCGAEDPNASKPGSIFDKIKDWLGGWFGKDEPEEPTEPSVPEEDTTVPSEPSEPSEPSKPGWGGWFDWFWPFR